MMAALRSVGVVLLGLVAGGLVVAGCEQLVIRAYPLPAGVDLNDTEALAKVVLSLPAGAFVGVLLGHGLGALAGAALAALLAGRAPRVHAMAVGAGFLMAGIANILMIPHPAWFIPLDLAAYPAAGYLGGWFVAGRRSRPEPAVVAA